jgi:hypothetical protein
MGQGYQEILRWNLCVRKNHSGTINKLKKELVGRNLCFCLLLPERKRYECTCIYP